MTKLPEKELLDGTKNPETTTGEFRLAMGNIRQFLFELFGDESSDKETARQTLGIDISRLNDGIASKADKQAVDAALEEKANKNELSLVATTGDYNHLANKPERSDTLESYGIIADSTPTAGSTRPVTSEGIKNYVNNRISALRHGMQLFTSSGIFTVPAGVTQVFVMCVGGGGGGGWYHGTGGAGGVTSFGAYATAPGGGGGYDDEVAGGAGAAGSATGPCIATAGNAGRASGGGSVPAKTFACGGWIDTYSFGAGRGGSAKDASSVGGSGGSVAAYITVTPGEAVAVTVGAGGGGTVAGLPGACYIEW
ncbi:hypothetical protein [Oxalobacter paraformigenes]|uniref:Tail fiber protein n=1 Tax=Oxalobacter paraformigenes TaxID=556268 RepID=C3X3V3_9BURK|nr:hypothetical protein [Oxalobacter paraformigenes]EEO27889.2 hypothetical protein OFAG_01042 [Oxalobacter paraformigenes]